MIIRCLRSSYKVLLLSASSSGTVESLERKGLASNWRWLGSASSTVLILSLGFVTVFAANMLSTKENQNIGSAEIKHGMSIATTRYKGLTTTKLQWALVL